MHASQLASDQSDYHPPSSLAFPPNQRKNDVVSVLSQHRL